MGSSLVEICAEVTGDVLDALSFMAPDDANKPRLQSWLLAGLTDGTPTVCLHTAVRGLARTLQPRRYLEIGVRRGWSLIQVAQECPSCEITGVDGWIANYADAPNPGPDFVREEVGRLAPSFFGALGFVPDLRYLPVSDYDMVTVDGDHRGWAAWVDLAFGLCRVAVGGAVVFDDLLDASDDGGPFTLRGAWERAKAEFGDEFTWQEFDGIVPIGVAVRQRASQREDRER